MAQVSKARSLADRTTNQVFATDFGVVADGITDDTVAFRAAVDYCIGGFKKWLNIVNAAGVGGVPGPVKIDGATHVSGGSSTFPAPGYQTQGGGTFDVIERVKYLFQRDVVQTYAGRVNLDGTTGGLPSGWTSAKLSTGRYEITHNFGSTGYEFISQATSGNNYSRENSKATNTFEYYTLDAAGTAVDADSKFILITTSHIPSA